jgi:hypothetical protein
VKEIKRQLFSMKVKLSHCKHADIVSAARAYLRDHPELLHQAMEYIRKSPELTRWWPERPVQKTLSKPMTASIVISSLFAGYGDIRKPLPFGT